MQLAAALFFPALLAAIFAATRFATESTARAWQTTGGAALLLVAVVTVQFGARVMYPVKGGVDDPACAGTACAPQLATQQ